MMDLRRRATTAPCSGSGRRRSAPGTQQGRQRLGRVMRSEAAKRAPDVVYVDTYRLFSDKNGDYSRSLPTGTARSSRAANLRRRALQRRTARTILPAVVFQLLDRRWHVAAQADPSQPIAYRSPRGAPTRTGVGHTPDVPSQSSYTTSTAAETTTTLSAPVTTTTISVATTDEQTRIDDDGRHHQTTKPKPTTTPPTTRLAAPPRPRSALASSGTADRYPAAHARRAACRSRGRRTGRRRCRLRRPSPRRPLPRAESSRWPHSTSIRWSPTTSPTQPPPSEAPAVMARYAEHGEVESMLARAYIADAVPTSSTRCSAAAPSGASNPAALADARRSSPSTASPAFLEHARRPLREARHRARTICRTTSSSSPTRSAASRTTRSGPVAEHVHRTNADVPEDIICGPRRDRRLRPLGAGGVRRVRNRRRVRLHGHGRRDRRALTRARSVSAARSSPGPRSSPGHWSPEAPKNRSDRGSRASRAAR